MQIITELDHLDILMMLEKVKIEIDSKGASGAVAVVNRDGDVVGFLRIGFGSSHNGSLAINKAFTSARDKKESKELGQASRQYDFPLSWFGDNRYTGFGGGAPLFWKDQCVGAIGISGLTEDEDTILARRVAEAFNQPKGS